MRSSHPMLVAAVLVAAACGGDSTTAPVLDLAPSYSVAVSGDITVTRSGVSLTQHLANGWSEETNGGATRYSSDVTLMSFAALDFTQPQTNIGLLGTAKVGTYRVRVTGGPFGGVPEFYGSYRTSNADGTSTVYDATSGTVTITSVSPVIRGTFAFHSARSGTWPAVVTVGTTITLVPASLDVSGSFVAKLP
jgi:hypothetical protein